MTHRFGFGSLFGKDFMKKKLHISFVFLVAALVLASTQDASAQATLGGVICNMYPNIQEFGPFFTWVAYVAGAFFAVIGIHHFRLHGDNPSNHPLNRPIMLWAGAATLLAMPSFTETLYETLYGTASPGGNLACQGTTIGSPGIAPTNAIGLDAALINFVADIRAPLISITSLIAILCGVFMIVNGLMKASKHGFDPKTHSAHSILTHLGFGALLFSIGDNLNAVLASLFGTSTTSATALSSSNTLSWSSSVSAALGPGYTNFQNAVNASLFFIQVIGVIAFVRGWLIMKKVVEGGGNVTLAQGITHILGGVAAINIFVFLKYMDSTFGTNLLS